MMTLIWRNIFLLSSLTAQIPYASASPMNHTRGGIHRRNDALDPLNDPSDDELEVTRKAAEILRELKTSNVRAVAAKRRLSPMDNPFEESYQSSRKNSHNSKRRRILTESKETAGFKITGLDMSDLSSDDGGVNAKEQDLMIDTSGKQNSQSKLREENRKLIIKIAMEFLDPLADIHEYDEWWRKSLRLLTE